MVRVKYSDIQRRGTPPMSPHMQLRFKGVWDMQDFYESVVNYLRDRKYKFYEKIYKHKHPSPFGVERQYIWQAEREIDEWAKVIIDISIHTYDAHDIEIKDKQGNMRIFTKGKIWIVLKLQDHWDYNQRFSQNKLWGAIMDFYIKYVVIKKRMLGYSPRFRFEQAKLYSYMQKRLKMESQDFEMITSAGVHRLGP